MKRLIKKLFGFTLTELMAVVVIVGILVIMSAGSFRQAVERSHFNEGLQAGASVQEAVNRFYYENLTSSDKYYPSIDELDIELSKSGSCATPSDHCAKTRYFEVEITNAGANKTVVQAYRTKDGVRKDFSIRFYPEYREQKRLEECLFTTAAGKTLCMSMGYYSCTSDNVCNRDYGFYDQN